MAYQKVMNLGFDFFRFRSNQFHSASLDGLWTFCRLSHYQYWFPQRRSFFLDTPRIG